MDTERREYIDAVRADAEAALARAEEVCSAFAEQQAELESNPLKMADRSAEKFETIKRKMGDQLVFKDNPDALVFKTREEPATISNRSDQNDLSQHWTRDPTFLRVLEYSLARHRGCKAAKTNRRPGASDRGAQRKDFVIVGNRSTRRQRSAQVLSRG